MQQRLLREGLLRAANHHPEKIALVIEGTSYSYKQLLDTSLRVAAALQNNGVRKGDRVCIFMENTWYNVVSIYGVLFAGCVFVVVNPQTKKDKLNHLLKDCQATALLTDALLAATFLPAIEGIKELSLIAVSGNLSERIRSWVHAKSFDTLIAENNPLWDPAPIIPNDLAALIYTSGSTGNPKGVMQTHQSMVFAAWSLIEYLRLSSKDIFILVLPLAFDYGLYQLLLTMKLGATLVIEKSFAFPVEIFRRIQEEKVTVFPGVPTIFARMIAMQEKKKRSFSSVTRVTNTAAALSEEFLPTLKEIFPNALIYKMYGLTECKRVSYLEPELLEAKPESVGKAIPGTEIFLQDADGNPVQQGKAGILHVRGPHLMRGYWNKPELSQKMLKPGPLPGENILCTHDLFKMDGEGYLYFVGRTDDIIKTRGEKVSPLEVERVLQKINGIIESAILGIPDKELGQAIHAFITVSENISLTERLIKKICLTKLEFFMVPEKITILPCMPKTVNNKIDKKELMTHSSITDC